MNNRVIIENYMEGWKTADAEKILSCLSPNCTIVESHGPTYHGITLVKAWIAAWTKTNKVEKWDLTSFYTWDNMLFCEWDFAYHDPESREEFNGITIAQVNQDKIIWLKEYRRTAPPYAWLP